MGGFMYITKAAIMYSNGEVLEGHDYGQMIYFANKLSLSGDKIDGFMTSSGDFVLPDQAAKIAFKAKQIETALPTLNPEDLWSPSMLQ